MTDKIEDGGPAFPSNPTQMQIMPDGSAPPLGFYGMSLRDWFAGQALANPQTFPEGFMSTEDIADQAYGVADAMLEARKAE